MQNVTTAITSGGQGLTVDEARQHLASGCPLVVPKQDWEQHKEWHGKLRIIQALQCSPVGREEAEQWDYATLLASWLTYEGPFPPCPWHPLRDGGAVRNNKPRSTNSKAVRQSQGTVGMHRECSD